MGLGHVPSEMRVSGHLLMPVLVGTTYGLLLVILLVSLYFALKRCSRHRCPWSTAAGLKGSQTPPVRTAVPGNVSRTVMTSSSPSRSLSCSDVVGMSLVPRRCPSRSKEAFPIRKVKSTVVDVGQEPANRSRPSSIHAAHAGLVIIPCNGEMKSSCAFPSGSSLLKHCGKDICCSSCTKGYRVRAAKNSNRLREQRAGALLPFSGVVARESGIKCPDCEDSQTREVSNSVLVSACVLCAPSEKTPSRLSRDKCAHQSQDINKGYKVCEINTVQGVFVSFSKTPPFTRLSSTNLTMDRAPVSSPPCKGHSLDVGGTSTESEIQVYNSSYTGHRCFSPLCTPHGCPCLVRRDNKRPCRAPDGQGACLRWVDSCSRSRQGPGQTRIMTCPHRAGAAARDEDVSKRQERPDVDAQRCKRRRPSADPPQACQKPSSRGRKMSLERAGKPLRRCRHLDVLRVSSAATRSDKLQVRIQEELGRSDRAGAVNIETAVDEKPLPTDLPGGGDACVRRAPLIVTSDAETRLPTGKSQSDCACAEDITVIVTEEAQLPAGSEGAGSKNPARTRTIRKPSRICSAASGHVSCASAQTSFQDLSVRSQQLPATANKQRKDTADPKRRQVLNVTERMSSGQLSLSIVGDGSNVKKRRLPVIKERSSDLKVHQPRNTK